MGLRLFQSMLTATLFKVAEAFSDKNLPKNWDQIVMLDDRRSNFPLLLFIDKCCISAFHESRKCPES